jgi:hypothetical protein
VPNLINTQVTDSRLAQRKVLTKLMLVDTQGSKVTKEGEQQLQRALPGVRRAFVLRPLVSREDVMRSRMNDLAGELCDGNALPLVLAFAERHRFSPEELARFRKMIDELEAKRGKRGSR